MFEEKGNGHKIVRISDVDSKILEDSNRSLEQLKKTVEDGKKMLTDLDEELSKINNNILEIDNKIVDACNSMIEEIKKIETALREKLEREITQTKNLIIKRCDDLKDTIEPIETFIEGVETKVNGDDTFVNLWNISEMAAAKKNLEALETEKLENIQFNYPIDVTSEKEKLKNLSDSLTFNKRIISLYSQKEYPPKEYTPLNFDKLSGTRNSPSEIPTGNNATHDGGSIFDHKKRIIISTSGDYNNGMSLKVSKLGSDMDNIKGETRLIENVIPFRTHGSYPVYDGEKWIYFFESESGSKNRFGRIDIDKLDSKDFKELPKIPSGFFNEFSSSVYHFGSIYSVNNDNNKLWRFIVSVNISIFFTTLLHLFKSFIGK